ncbi:MAG TPA: AAA family ATPase [Rhizomicrobium sp.]
MGISAAGWAIDAALAELDAALRREILRLRARYQLSLDEFHGLCITDAQVDVLVGQNRDRNISEPCDFCIALSGLATPGGTLGRLAAAFELNAVELALLFVAAAPEFDAKYEALYAYLNNDVARKLPTTDLALRLLANDEAGRLAVRAALAPSSALVSQGLLHHQTRRSDGEAFQVQQPFRSHEAIAPYLLGVPLPASYFAGGLAKRTPTALYEALSSDASLRRTSVLACQAAASARIVFLEAAPSLSARGFALATSLLWKRPLWELNFRRIPRERWPEAVGTANLVSRLSGAILLVAGTDALHDPDGRMSSDTSLLRAFTRAAERPLLVEASTASTIAELFDATDCLRLRLTPLEQACRRALWDAVLAGHGAHAEPADLDDVSSRFQLPPEGIEAAALGAADAASGLKASRTTLFAAARAQSESTLARLAQRIPHRHGWSDLILPAQTKSRVRALIEALASRDLVLGEWKMGAALGTAGLRALFAGPSGTGKTMAAGIVAAELGVDAYRIDLSQVVSKYIGETEKNLERIFQGAASANAILFFDEADALFGKRSEVKDAHDRHANVEVAYLLQRIEDFDGIVILATNISRNIDSAFARRMHFALEFPLPGPSERERLWRNIFPATAPLAGDIDYAFLARRFELAGGDIRNVALDAAFLAARGDRRIAMRHIVQGLARELVKQGRSPSVADFKQHYTLLDSAEG